MLIFCWFVFVLKMLPTPLTMGMKNAICLCAFIPVFLFKSRALKVCHFARMSRSFIFYCSLSWQKCVNYVLIHLACVENSSSRSPNYYLLFYHVDRWLFKYKHHKMRNAVNVCAVLFCVISIMFTTVTPSSLGSMFVVALFFVRVNVLLRMAYVLRNNADRVFLNWFWFCWRNILICWSLFGT